MVTYFHNKSSNLRIYLKIDSHTFSFSSLNIQEWNWIGI